MALQDIPVLPTGYPLFSWEDWQASRDALVQGGPTEYFAKECWNAIIDTLADALEEGGIEWSPGTPDDCKINRAYGQLTADAFNTALDNVGQVLPAGWKWAYDKAFRGYVGKDRFAGTHFVKNEQFNTISPQYGDKVYPEYILELVRRINLMIEIMRGTGPVADTRAKQKSGINTKVTFTSATVVPCGADVIVNLAQSVELRSGAILPTEVEQKSNVNTDITIERKRKQSVPVAANVHIRQHTTVEGQTRTAAPCSPRDVYVRTKAFCELWTSHFRDLAVTYLVKAHAKADLKWGSPINGSASVLTTSAENAEVRQGISFPVESRTRTWSNLKKVDLYRRPAAPMYPDGILVHSREAAEMHQGKAVKTSAETLIQSRTEAEVISKKVILMDGAKTMFSSTVQADAAAGKAAAVSGEFLCGVVTNAGMDKQLALPMSGSVLIGMSAKTQMETMKTTTSEATVNVSSKVRCKIGSAWLPPLWINDGLWIRQVQGLEVRSDGSIEIRGDNMAAKIKATYLTKTLVKCTLDTAWNPPVYVDGGLWIQQLRSVNVNDNNELEVI